MLTGSLFARCRTSDPAERRSDGECEALRLIEQKLKAGAWTWDLETGETHWTPGLYAVLDLDPEIAPPSRESFESVIHPDDLRLSHDFGKSIAEGLPFDRRLRIIRRDGRVRWLHSQHEVLFDRAGKPRRAVGVLQDVTEEQEELQSEQTWKDTYHALVRAVGALGSIVWVTRAEPFIVQIVNELPGHEPSAYIGDAWKDVIHPDDIEPAMKAFKQAVETLSPHAVDQRVRRPDGQWRWFRIRAVPMINRDGSVRGWMGVSLDIHDERDWSARSAGQSTLTGAQICGARGVLNWSVRDLADRAGVSPAIIRRLEERDGAPSELEPAMARIKTALEAGGIEFLFPPLGKPGLRPV